jgi:hypothetical protein
MIRLTSPTAKFALPMAAACGFIFIIQTLAHWQIGAMMTAVWVILVGSICALLAMGTALAALKVPSGQVTALILMGVLGAGLCFGYAFPMRLFSGTEIWLRPGVGATNAAWVLGLSSAFLIGGMLEEVRERRKAP